MEMIKFKDKENDTVIGGFLLDNGDIVCGCCGNIFHEEEFEDYGIEIIDYLEWIDINEAIIGE